MVHKIILPLLFIFLFIGYAHAQNTAPKSNPDKKDQYDKSAKQAEQQSQDDMKKQNDEFIRKKKYKKLTKKGKPASTGKAKPESLIIYTDKKKLIA